MNLDHARTLASHPVEDSDDADRLRLLVFELCDEIESMRAVNTKAPRHPDESE